MTLLVERICRSPVKITLLLSSTLIEIIKTTNYLVTKYRLHFFRNAFNSCAYHCHKHIIIIISTSGIIAVEKIQRESISLHDHSIQSLPENDSTTIKQAMATS
jgi:hypothetical protein